MFADADDAINLLHDSAWLGTINNQTSEEVQSLPESLTFHDLT